MNSAVQWIKTRPTGVYISAMLSLEAVRRQMADIDRNCIPQADCTWKEGMTEYVGSALDLPICGLGSSGENGSWLKVS